MQNQKMRKIQSIKLKDPIQLRLKNSVKKFKYLQTGISQPKTKTNLSRFRDSSLKNNSRMQTANTSMVSKAKNNSHSTNKSMNKTINSRKKLSQDLTPIPSTPRNASVYYTGKCRESRVRSVKVQRRRQFTEKLDGKNRKLFKIIHIQRCWRIHYYTKLDDAAALIQKVYFGYLFRKCFIYVKTFNLQLNILVDTLNKSIVKSSFLKLIHQMQIWSVSSSLKMIREEKKMASEKEGTIDRNKGSDDYGLRSKNSVPKSGSPIAGKKTKLPEKNQQSNNEKTITNSNKNSSLKGKNNNIKYNYSNISNNNSNNNTIKNSNVNSSCLKNSNNNHNTDAIIYNANNSNSNSIRSSNIINNNSLNNSNAINNNNYDNKIDMKMHLGHEMELQIKTKDYIYTQEPKENINIVISKPIPYKSQFQNKSMFTKKNYTQKEIQSPLYQVILIQRLYRKHFESISRSRGKGKSCLKQSDLFKVKLFTFYMNHQLFQGMLKFAFNQIKNAKKQKKIFIKPLNLDISRNPNDVSKQNSSNVSVNNELESVDYKRLNNLNNAQRGMHFPNEKGDDDMAITENSFEDDWDENVTLKKNIPYSFVPFSYQQGNNDS